MSSLEIPDDTFALIGLRMLDPYTVQTRIRYRHVYCTDPYVLIRAYSTEATEPVAAA